MKKRRKHGLMMVLLVLAIMLVIVIALIILLPKDEKKTDFSSLNGFYQLKYLEGYNFKFHSAEDGCDYSYKGISLVDGDRIINARVLSNTLCKFCGKNETVELPSDYSRVSLNIYGTETAEGDIFFEGTGAELRDIILIQ